MGSLKDEMRGVREENKPCDKTDDGERPESSHGTAEPDGPQINTNQESTAPQPKPHMNAHKAQETDQNGKSKDQALSGGCCGKDPQTEDDKTTAAHDSAAASIEFLSDGDGETLVETTQNKSVRQDGKKGGEIENILMPVPATPGPSDPLSPAPAGQHHMRTQVSLEVVQCRSAATSPMTPPEGAHSFFFPSSFGKSAAAGADSKDAELQVGRQVEFCSVATSPMTPKTPSTTAFPELTGRERSQKQDEVKNSEVRKVERGQQEKAKDPEETRSEIPGTLKCTTLKEHSACFSSNGSSPNAAWLTVSQISPGEGNQQCKQQRMGSMDQDITILVTHYGNNEEEEEEKAESYCPTLETEMVKIDEYEEQRENNSDAKKGDGKENICAETAAPDVSISNPPHSKTEGSSGSAGAEAKTDSNSKVKENRVELGKVPKPDVPESPAPLGCHNIRTQVSLEVVQCQSAATSPMTPPEGDQAFYFPSSLGRCAGVDTEATGTGLQVGPQVEFRSVATAPMTPRTPTVITFPEVRKDARNEEKIVVEEEDEEKVTEKKEEEAAEEDLTEAINCTEKGEEPVQEVRWDEKGMTWEVYGAVVEVAVLGSAIQKHLEKQVKKQKPSMPPPPPLNPSAMPLSPESIQGGSGSGSALAKGRPGKRGDRNGEVSRRRRNPFRQLMENMQQPRCCSRAHSAE